MTPRKGAKRKSVARGGPGLLQTSLTAFLTAPTKRKAADPEITVAATDLPSTALRTNNESVQPEQRNVNVHVTLPALVNEPRSLRVGEICEEGRAGDSAATGDLKSGNGQTRREVQLSDGAVACSVRQQEMPESKALVNEKVGLPLDDQKSEGRCTPRKRSDGTESARKSDLWGGVKVERETPHTLRGTQDQSIVKEEAGQAPVESSPAPSGHEDGVIDEEMGGGDSDGAMDGGENEFEREREERIRRNQQMLLKLGIDNAAAGVRGAAATQAAPQRRPAQRRPAKKSAAEVVPVRRSSRSRGISASDTATALEVDAAVAAEEAAQRGGAEQDTIVYDDSDVLRYVCDSANADCGLESAFPVGQRVEGFSVAAQSLYDAKLTRAYGMDKSGDLLVAGGHQGWASVWGLGAARASGGEAEDVAPLMSAKLHSGWICDVQFLPREGGQLGGGGAPLLLSASNDAAVALWDVSRAATGNGKPFKLLESRDVHQSGVFSMHAFGSSVLTASKDYTVAVSEIRSEAASLHFIRRFDIHGGVVKCARWRDGNTFASGGNDRAIHVCDNRSSASSPSLSIHDAHPGAVNHLQWNPRAENLLLSSGFDDAIQVFDTRSPTTPLMTFRGHSRKSKSIYQPLWGDGGKCVISGGDSHLLSVYCCATSKALSRGEIGFEPKAACLADPSAAATSTLFLATTKRIVVCQPVPMLPDGAA